MCANCKFGVGQRKETLSQAGGQDGKDHSEKNMGENDKGDELGHEVVKIIYKAWLGCAKTGKQGGTNTEKSNSCPSEPGENENVESTEAMEELSLILSDDSTEDLEEWLKKN